MRRAFAHRSSASGRRAGRFSDLKRGGPTWATVGRLMLAGLVCMALGWAADATGICPSVKRIWTPSWTLFRSQTRRTNMGHGRPIDACRASVHGARMGRGCDGHLPIGQAHLDAELDAFPISNAADQHGPRSAD